MDDEEAVDWGYDESEEEAEPEVPAAPTSVSIAATSVPIEVEALLDEAPVTVKPPVAALAPAGAPAASAASTEPPAVSRDESSFPLTAAAGKSEAPVAAAAEPAARGRASDEPTASGAPVSFARSVNPARILMSPITASGTHSSRFGRLDGLVGRPSGLSGNCFGARDRRRVFQPSDGFWRGWSGSFGQPCDVCPSSASHRLRSSAVRRLAPADSDRSAGRAPVPRCAHAGARARTERQPFLSMGGKVPERHRRQVLV